MTIGKKTMHEKKSILSKRKWWMVSLSFVICHFSMSTTSAQTFLDRIQKPVEGQGKITIHQDSSINELVINPQSTVKPEDRRPNGSSHPTPVRTPQATAPRDTTTTTSTPATTTPPQASPRNRRVVNGFRIQAYAGGNSREDRKRAERTANSIRTQFPNVAVSAHFYPPRWICYVGNYRTRDEAEHMLRTLKHAGYSQALIVKAKVIVH
jgi:hypothetical protein